MADNMYYGAGATIFQRAEELRKTMTSAENIIWKHIHINEWKLKFRRQHPILFYVADFYCHALKLVIEIDGGIHDNEEVKKNDAEREANLKALGLHIIRFRNEEVFTNPKVVLEKIDQTIRTLQSPPLGDGGCRELALIASQLQQAYDGDSWFGRSVKSLLDGVDEATAFQQPSGQHSILQLVWHMVNWRAFVVNSLWPKKPVSYFDEMDWQELDHNNKTLWPEGLQKLEVTQQELIALLNQADDAVLANIVPGRHYDFRYLLHGLIQHDIYHAGQIAYINKVLQSSSTASN